MSKSRNDIIMRRSVFVWIALFTGLILLVPAIAMQFTKKVNWDETDFIVMGLLIFGASSVFVLISRKVPRKYRIVPGALLTAVFFFVWAEFAVGIFTNLGN